MDWQAAAVAVLFERQVKDFLCIKIMQVTSQFSEFENFSSGCTTDSVLFQS